MHKPGKEDPVNNYCTSCHGSDLNGSAIAPSCNACHGTQGAHATHLSGTLGAIGCSQCHDTNDYPFFKTGTDGNGDGKYNLAETDVCDGCHSLDGVTSAKAYYMDDQGTWAAAEGEESFCGSCHDGTPGYNGGSAAFDVMGDNSTYGFYITGHGKASGTYARLSWQDTSATGNPAANRPCGACHDLVSQHFGSTTKRLKAGYENNQDNDNCNNCHAPAGSATADPQWYTQSDEYESSAHYGTLCTDCHDVHGMAGDHAAMTVANQESLCYQCHTDGVMENDAISNNRPGGYNSADDIEEAFTKPEKHNLGTSFSVNGSNYSLECISCHNVHVVSGKYWNAEEDRSPVTRFPGNSDGFPATLVWGDNAGEKMDDFAARGSGTGGFYYKTAQGYSLGSMGLSFDRPAAYRPPKAGSGYRSEYEGAVLPDYATFCLDCHSGRVVEEVGAINWGQGIGCGFPEPPGPGYGNWVTCSSPHGLSPANMSSYVSDSGTAGFWGSSGNPDAIFDMNYVTRGRHNGHFMRWPYDSADRGAGINFVMACTDCHEAHGSNRGSMIRERFNVNDSGACGTGGSSGENCSDGGNWNSFCNTCHYYYGGQHAGMSCGNASCHEANSIHRIKKNGGGGSTQLIVTAAGYESSFVRPDFTPEIISVIGYIGSNDLEATFRASQYGTGSPGIFTNDDLTGALQPEDFWLFDKNGNNNPDRTITGVTHTAGETTATITLSEPMQISDLDTDTIAVRPSSIWGWYEGGYVNAATGTLPPEVVSAGPWPVTITTPHIDITTAEGLASYNEIYVQFSEGAYTNNDGTGDLQITDFVLTDMDDGRTITGVQHTAGDSTAILTLSSPLDVYNDVGTDTVAAVFNSIFGVTGSFAGTDTVAITEMASPVISSAEGADGSTKLLITFTDNVYTDKSMSGALQPSDFILTDSDNGREISSIDHIPGDLAAILNLDIAMDSSNDFLVDNIAAVAGSIFGETDYPVGTTPVTISEIPVPQIVAVTGQVDYDKLEVRFNNAVYAETGMTGSLEPTDFVLTDSDNVRTITDVEHTPGVENRYIGEDIAWLTLSEPLDSTDDIGIDTVAANGIYNFLDAPVDATPVTITDMPATVITAVEGALDSNKLKVTFSHWVFGDEGRTGTIQPEDFVLTDSGGNNPRTIMVVEHGVGESWALVTMSGTLAVADVDTDTVGAAAASIFNSADHPVSTASVTISAAATPTITSVEGTTGLDEILVFFSEAVYAETGSLGDLLPSDFILTDADDSRAITGVEHTAGSASAILTLSSPLDGTDDINTDTLAAGGIYSRMDIAVDESPVTLTGNNCPVGGTRFDFDEGAGSATVIDDTGLITGTVGNPSFSMLGDGLYTGDETEAELTYIDLNSEDQCLKTPRALTIETRIYFGNVDLDYVDVSPANGIDDDYDAGLPIGNECCSRDGDGRNTTGVRIAETLKAWQFTVFRGNWSTTDAFVPDRARIIFKYRVTDRGLCDGNYPGDPTGEGSPVNGAWFKQISSDTENYPIVTDHWYRIRIVFNTDKPRLAVDIFADDQGTDGGDSGELWSGYKNVSRPDPEDSSACKWAAIPGLVMNTEDNTTSIGDNTNHVRPGADDQGDYRNTTLKGKLDWLSWKPVVDYSGVDDLPY
jgi:predicted CXXCH cytochrome family protein